MRFRHLLALVALCVAGPASAATYTVAPSGSDSNNGVSAPFATVQKAASVLQDGDTIYFQAGTYSGGTGLITANNITLRGNGDAILDGSNSSRIDGISLYQCNGVTIDGLKLQNCKRAGIFCVQSDNVTIQNCDASYNGTTGILTGNTSDMLIQNNTTAYNKGEHGIYCSQSGDRLKLINNRVIGNNGSGLQINAVEDSPNANAGPNNDSRSQNCLVAGNVLTGNCRAGGAAMNFMGLQSSVVVNNLIYADNSGGMAFWDDGAGAAFACTNDQVYHNTVVFGAGKGIYGVQFAPGSTGNVLKNNVLVVNAGPAIDASEAIQSNCNVFGGNNVANGSSLASWRNSTGNDQNSQVADPKLDGSYHPQAGSPCIDAGEQVYGTDKDGALRPQGAGPDLGCYEVSASSSGGSSGGSPSTLPAPAGLSAQAGNGQVALSWGAVSGSAGYCVYRSGSSAGSYSKLNATPLSAAGFTDSSVSNGSTYWYRVCAVDGSSREGASTTSVSASPAAPAANTFSISGTVTLGGAGLSGATVSGGGQAAVTDANGRYTLSGLSAGAYTVSCSLSGYTFSGAQSVTLSGKVSGVNFTATAATPVGDSGLIYDDSLQNGWTASQSRASYSLANQSPVEQGSRSIALTIAGANGYLQVSGKALQTSGKSVLKFWVHGGARGRQALRVRAITSSGVQSSFSIWAFGGTPQAGKWVEYAIPLATLRAANTSLTGIRFTASAAQSQAYIDFVRVE